MLLACVRVSRKLIGRNANRWRLGIYGGAYSLGQSDGVRCLRALQIGSFRSSLRPLQQQAQGDVNASPRIPGWPARRGKQTQPRLLFPSWSHFDFKQDKIFGDEISEAGKARSPRSWPGYIVGKSLCYLL